MNKLMELDEFYEFILKNKSVVDYDTYAIDVNTPNFKRAICFEVRKVNTEQKIYLADPNNISDFSEILSYWKRVNNSKRRLHYYDANFGTMLMLSGVNENPLDKFFKYRYNRVKKYLAYRLKRELDRGIKQAINEQEQEDFKPLKTYKL